MIQPANRLSDVQEYYFSKKLKEIRELNASGKNIINLGIGSPDLAPSHETIEALVKTAEQTNAHGYQSYIGIPEFREAISSWMAFTYGVGFRAENEILPLMGSKEGIMHISMAFLNPGDKVLVPNPGYPTYTSVSNLLNAEIEFYDLDEKKNWNIDVNNLRKKDLSNVKLLWLNYPHMPTGARADLEVLNDLIALAKEKKFLIVNDNPYSLILNPTPRSIFNLEGAKEVCLELNSLSKSHNMAGWRIGWLSGSSEYISTVLRVKSNMDSGMFLGLQKAAVQALSNPMHWHEDQNNIYAKRRKLIEEIFDYLEVKYNPNSVGMFVWAKVPDSVDNVEKFVDDILYKADVFITPGFIFGSNGERYIRASLCASQETIKEALSRIKANV
ncbi:MAG: aminotransferase [Flavobacteriales bacterium]|nr:aminotransferase [Flavobacteriales bacterium]